YGFFALVVFAPVLQEQGGTLLAWGMWVILGPFALILSIVAGDLCNTCLPTNKTLYMRWIFAAVIAAAAFWGLFKLGVRVQNIRISTGVNALNASILLAVMALPTIVSVCEDSLTAVGRSLREGSYALGATKAETMVKVILPAASGGIVAAVILGIMRAIGETMVVLMAAGNSFEIPEPWFNLLSGVRTLTATIALEMGETDQTAGSSHYHALFALAFYLLIFSFICNIVSEWAVRRTKRRLKGL
ncbi:MAG: PstC family ABC transporter permease, partial [Verrucomicrobiota bacterium]